MMSRFCRYVEKVFGLTEMMGQLKDSRAAARIGTGTVWLSGLVMFALRRGSLNAIEGEFRMPRRLKGLVGLERLSADTMGRVFSLMESEGPRRMLCGINHQLKRNKVLVLPKGQQLWWVAVDGHELFASRSRHCAGCSRRTVRVKDHEEVEYYHRGVSCHLIGQQMALPLDFELIGPGEGQTVAARRMLERVIQNYGRFFDGLVADALYLDAPTFNFCLEHHKHVVAVIKKDSSVLLNDARGLFAQTRPVQWEVPGGVIRCWDIEGFNTFEGVKAPIRVLHSEETITKHRRREGQRISETTVHQWYWATTVQSSIESTRSLWKTAHGRWDIENDQFNTLSTHWSMDHCFKHDPGAILNFILTLFVAYVLLQSFHQRNLKPPVRRKLTLIALASELHLGLICVAAPAPWVARGSPSS